MNERWEDGGLYEQFIGRWSRLVAREFLPWLELPENRRWLDIGCGTGALSRTIVELASPEAVTAIDPSQGYVDFARRQLPDRRVTFEIGSADALRFGDETFDAVVSGLVLNFVPSPDRALKEMKRVARRGGVVGVYLWDYSGGMEYIRYFWDAARAFDPAAGELDEGGRFPICRPDPLKALLVNAGLDDVEVRPIDVSIAFRNFDDYWNPILGGQGPAPGYAMSLSEDRRSQLRERLRVLLPMESDGSIKLMVRAWAARGIQE